MTLYRHHHITALRDGHRWIAYAMCARVGVANSEAAAMMIARRKVDDYLWRQFQSSMGRVIPLRQPRGRPDWRPTVIDCGLQGPADEWGEW